MSFTFADLFAGIGGFHAALSKHGGESVFVSEIDDYARNVYAENWLNGREDFISGDITKLTAGSVQVPKHNVLTGGFPCQPFSKSGSQRGVAEARGTLFYDIHRIIDTKKPDLILLDNMNPTLCRKAVEVVAGQCKLEASGGITLESAKEFAQSGVDYLAIGALTHSAPVLDIGLDLRAE